MKRLTLIKSRTKRSKLTVFSILGLLVFLASCGGGGEFSQTTGRQYGEETGGFAPADAREQEPGPGLVYIEGGAFTMGRTEEDVMRDWNNFPRRVTVASFYMDETEIANIDWREYLFWLRQVFVEAEAAGELPEIYTKALPDTLVWRRPLAYNEPYVAYYFRHPAYNNYPVVGISWTQCDAYCIWRTDRVNETRMLEEEMLEPGKWGDSEGDIGEAANFNTEAYLAGLITEGVNKMEMSNGDERYVNMSDGILLPRYELPTEAQWEYAALSIISFEERIYDRRIYPWDGHFVRNDGSDGARGRFRANFQRGRGDMMGVAGALNDDGAITREVDSYWPNDFGLYCMAGNVSEWVRDVYRPLTPLDEEEFNPFRGNVFNVYATDYQGKLQQDEYGYLMKVKQAEDLELFNRYNYQRADNINYADGDIKSSMVQRDKWKPKSTPDTSGGGAGGSGNSTRMYAQMDDIRDESKGESKVFDSGWSSLINDRARVYKGGSWRDRAYWLSPGSRRFLQEDMSRDDLGFRCSMIHMGPRTSITSY